MPKNIIKMRRGGFTLIEVLVAVLVVSVSFTAVMTLLIFDSVCNNFEQERIRAHQIVSEEMENVRRTLYTRLTSGRTVTVWDNGTPAITTDDTVGTLEVTVRDPKSGVQLTQAPVPATRVQVEVTLIWHPRGSNNNKTMHETLMTYIAP